MEKINIAELLKDCPKGMELDCILFNNPVTLDEVADIDEYSCPITVTTVDGDIETFTKYGQHLNRKDAKCIIFPKGKTTWEGFEPPCKFKDGDVVATTNSSWIGITEGGYEQEYIPTYCVIKDNVKFEAYFNKKRKWAFDRLATEEEKQKLFQAIKDNGYKWNAETKTLEKLIVPKFKKGDKIRVKNGVSEPRIIDDVCDTFYTLVPIGTIDFTEQNKWELVPNKLIKPNFRVGDTIQDVDGYKVEITKVNIDEECYEYLSIIAKGIGSILFKHQNEWNLVSNKSVKPKFKVGDRVRLKSNSDYIYTIYCLTWDDNKKLAYKLLPKNDKHLILVSLNKQDNYELVPNKFDITTLKPFDKVLVRLDNANQWYATGFSHIDERQESFCRRYVTVSGKSYTQMIPYKGNEHLCGKKDDCDDFYKTWK